MVSLEPTALRALKIAPRVEVLGVFGSGKTTLVERVASSNLRALSESHENNPYWGNDSAIAMTGYLPYDLTFLLHHAVLVSETRAIEGEFAICDWSFVSDRLWAAMRLTDDFGIYDKAYQAMIARIGPPLGYFYLRQSPETIVERIAKRDRIPERQLSTSVENAVQQLDRAVSELASTRVLIVRDDLDSLRAYEQLRIWSQR